VEVLARGVRHEIVCQPDRIRQKPEVTHEQHPAPDVETGTTVRLHWPDSACSILEKAKRHFLQIAAAYPLLNPHLTLTVDWFGEPHRTEATTPGWRKWLPSDPTCPHWYTPERFERLIRGYIADDADRKGRKAERTVRGLVAEFRGLSGTAKQKAVLEATGITRTPLSGLVKGRDLDRKAIARLLAAMQQHSKPVKPAALGVIGRDHLARRFEALGCDMKVFSYSKALGEEGGLPFVIETAFAMRAEEKEDEGRVLVAGVNWSPGILNPFRELGHMGRSLDEVLEEKRISRGDPIVLVLHMACPRVEYTDRGKSAIVIEGEAEDLEDELEAAETEEEAD
jgi:DNA topoisomerase VI subunit B